MLVIIKAKDTDNIIGLKEDIAARLEDVADIESIFVFPNDKIVIPKLNINWKEVNKQ